MTVYARSDVMGVTLSKDHGGCGATHSRPVTQGSPSKVWALNCHPCEDHLRADPRWSSNTAEIPETPDEERIRGENEKRGERGYAANLEASVASLAASQEGMQKLLTIMIAATAGNNPEVAALLAGLNTAPAVVTQDVIDAEVAALAADMHGTDGLDVLKSAAQGTQDAFPDLSTLKLTDLRALAKGRGFDATGGREDLVARLTGQG